MCDGKLLTHADRPSTITVYSDKMGTIPATHFHKYCQNSRKGCQFTQYYGYFTLGEGSETHYDNWHTLPFFILTSMTAFETRLLECQDAEFLIGQITYNQNSDIYNYVHKYNSTTGSINPKDNLKKGS